MEMAHRLVALFMRHGSTPLNDQGKFRGPLDPDLDENGVEQAKQLSKDLKGYKSGPSFTSSKKRSKQTAEIALEDIEGHRTKALRQLDAFDIGKFAGQDKSPENMKKIEYYQNNPDKKIPGGESLAEFRARVNPKIKMIIRKGQEGGRPSLAFVHSSTIHQLGHLLHNDHNHIKVKPGGIVGVFRGPYGLYAKALTKESHDPKDKNVVS